ncbi:MAG: HD domain-containing protein [Clostridia bacterium]|nr:HD domain-containing protein [Clostridia bacterium]
MNIADENKYVDLFVRDTKDLLRDPLVESMKTYRHHGETTTHYHSVYVSYRVLKLCVRLGAQDRREIVRAALLHDFYLYEWYTEKHDENHIFYHPKESVKNIEAHFGTLTPMQRNMILSHMFPLCRELPHSAGAWILTAADKRCASEDYLHASRAFRSVYDEINRRASL